MEGIPDNPRQTRDIQKLVDALAKKAPDDERMQDLVRVLGQVVAEAEKKKPNTAYIHLKLEGAQALHGALASKGIDAISELNEISERIRKLVGLP
jgi:DNA-binding ferritin-like protein